MALGQLLSKQMVQHSGSSLEAGNLAPRDQCQSDQNYGCPHKTVGRIADREADQDNGHQQQVYKIP